MKKIVSLLLCLALVLGLSTMALADGEKTIYILTPTGSDNSAVKSCNIHGLSVYLTKEAAPAKGTETAPQTADTAMLSVAALAFSAAAAVVAAQRRRGKIAK